MHTLPKSASRNTYQSASTECTPRNNESPLPNTSEPSDGNNEETVNTSTPNDNAIDAVSSVEPPSSTTARDTKPASSASRITSAVAAMFEDSLNAGTSSATDTLMIQALAMQETPMAHADTRHRPANDCANQLGNARVQLRPAAQEQNDAQQSVGAE